MSNDFVAALQPVLDRFRHYLADKPEVRAELVELTKACQAWLSTLQHGSVIAETTLPGQMFPAAEVIEKGSIDQLALSQENSAATRPTSELSSVPEVMPKLNGTYSFDSAGREFIPLPLVTVAARCRVKCAAAKIMAKRSAGANSAELDQEEAKLRKQAEELSDCSLWMLETQPSKCSKAHWENLAGGYAVCATGSELLKQWSANGPDLSRGQEVLTCCAEAQSMLLYAVAAIGAVHRDHEQVQLFVHIRELGKIYQIYVPRFLRKEDPADPSKWGDLARRIALTIAGQGATLVPGDAAMMRTPASDTALQGKKALDNLRYKLRRVAEGIMPDVDEWKQAALLLDQAAKAGVPPSSLALREMLVPVYPVIPRDLEITPHVERIFRAVELHLETLEAEAELPDDCPPEANPEVLQVARFLQGRELVLIGGLRRTHHVEALKAAFGLADVRWLTTPEHTSFTVFESDIARPNVAAVLLAIRWSSHDYASVQEYCTKYGKPLIRLKSGYNANQVAHSLLAQASHRLVTPADSFAEGL